MQYSPLSKGQKILVNTGFNLVEYEVLDSNNVLVVVPGKDYLRSDCYAIPDEMDRLIFDSRLLADAYESVANQMKERK